MRTYFPHAKRNATDQAADGGTDLINTGQFAFEMKHGKEYRSVMVRRIIEQTESQANGLIPVAVIKPDREPAYVVIPFEQFKRLL